MHPNYDTDEQSVYELLCQSCGYGDTEYDDHQRDQHVVATLEQMLKLMSHSEAMHESGATASATTAPMPYPVVAPSRAKTQRPDQLLFGF